MNKSGLLRAVARKNPSLRADEIQHCVDAIFERIAQHLAEGSRVELRGFGTFTARKRDGRSARNPRTGDAVEVPGKRIPFFKAGKNLRELVNVN